jgi:5-methylcytosine-specific restriction endonuclease McrA
MSKRHHFSKAERTLITTRAQRTCEYCRSLQDYSPDSFEAEHIIPVVRGGSDDLGNIALACSGCNKRKSDRITAIDPFSTQIVPLFNPRTDIWAEHFEWSENFSQMIGISLIGRATIEALQTNRNGLVNLRLALFAYGVHPPSI